MLPRCAAGDATDAAVVSLLAQRGAWALQLDDSGDTPGDIAIAYGSASPGNFPAYMCTPPLPSTGQVLTRLIQSGVFWLMVLAVVMATSFAACGVRACGGAGRAEAGRGVGAQLLASRTTFPAKRQALARSLRCCEVFVNCIAPMWAMMFVKPAPWLTVLAIMYVLPHVWARRLSVLQEPHLFVASATESWLLSGSWALGTRRAFRWACLRSILMPATAFIFSVSLSPLLSKANHWLLNKWSHSPNPVMRVMIWSALISWCFAPFAFTCLSALYVCCSSTASHQDDASKAVRLGREVAQARDREEVISLGVEPLGSGKTFLRRLLLVGRRSGPRSERDCHVSIERSPLVCRRAAHNVQHLHGSCCGFGRAPKVPRRGPRDPQDGNSQQRVPGGPGPGAGWRSAGLLAGELLSFLFCGQDRFPGPLGHLVHGYQRMGLGNVSARAD